MTQLQDQVSDAIGDLDLPETDLVRAILAELDSPVTRPGKRRSRRALLAVAAAGIVILSVLAVAPAREAVARWFGIGATRVEIVPSMPPSDVTTRDLSDVLQGEIIEVSRNPIPNLGAPSRTVDADGSRHFAWVATAGQPAIGDTEFGVVLSVRPIDGEPDLKRSSVDVGVEVVTIDVDGTLLAGLWIDGTHELIAAGSSAPVLAESVLIWAVEDVQYRLETNLDLDGAVAIAQLVDGGTDLLAAG